MLKAIFNQFNADGSGEITPDDIICAMGKIGHCITQSELDQIMTAHDLNHDGTISFEDFKRIFVDFHDTKAKII